MMPKKIFIFALAVLALSLLVSGCGSDDSLTKAEFTKQANAICVKSDNAEYDAKVKYGKKYEDEISKIGLKTFTKGSNTTAVLPLVQTEAEEIEDLGAPEGEEEQVEAFLAAIDTGIAKVEKDPSLSEEFGFKNAFADANAKAGSLGLKKCIYVG